VESRGGVVEVLDAEQDAFRDDPENLRKNHWGEFLRIGDREGYSNDRDDATIPGFQVDKAPIIRIADIFGGTPELRSLVLHSELMYQYGVLGVVTKDMRIIR